MLKKNKTSGRATLDDVKKVKATYDMARKRKSSGRLSADDMMDKKPSKYSTPPRKNSPMQTGPYGPTNPDRKKMMQKLGNKFAGSMASQVGGGLKKPMESVFQKLKKAQMMRKRKGK